LWKARNNEKDLREALRRLRAALPETPIPDNEARRIADTATRPGKSRPCRPFRRLSRFSGGVARETGCGFFDTFHAMGGAGTIGARWYAAQPRLVYADFIHP
jgi:hypothetical protein